MAIGIRFFLHDLNFSTSVEQVIILPALPDPGQIRGGSPQGHAADSLPVPAGATQQLRRLCQDSLPVRPGRLREGLLWRQQGRQFGGAGGIAQPEH